MHHPSNNGLGFALGVVSGAWRQYILTGSLLVLSGPHYSDLFDVCKSGMTALVCGGAGVLGKVIVSQLWKRWLRRRKLQRIQARR